MATRPPIAASELKRYEEGEELVRKGTADGTMYIIISGLAVLPRYGTMPITSCVSYASGSINDAVIASIGIAACFLWCRPPIHDVADPHTQEPLSGNFPFEKASNF